MDDDVGIDHQGVDGRAVQNVALPVGGFRPAVGGGVKRPTRHPDDALHRRITLQRFHYGDPDVTRGPGYRDRERHLISVRLLVGQYSETALYGSTLAPLVKRVAAAFSSLMLSADGSGARDSAHLVDRVLTTVLA